MYKILNKLSVHIIEALHQEPTTVLKIHKYLAEVREERGKNEEKDYINIMTAKVYLMQNSAIDEDHLLQSQHLKLNEVFFYLLEVCCQFGLIEELHHLLTAFKDKIDINKVITTNGKTLLGTAAYYGQYGVVKYLIEVQAADMNATDRDGNTALHQVVYGDIHHYNSWQKGYSHDRVAQYLLWNGANHTLKNNEKQNPCHLINRQTPNLLESAVKIRLFYPKSSASYTADNVRYIFFDYIIKKYAKNDSWQVLENTFNIEMDLPTNLKFIPLVKKTVPPVAYNEFRLKFALTELMLTRKLLLGYKTPEEMFIDLHRSPDNIYENISSEIFWAISGITELRTNRLASLDLDTKRFHNLCFSAVIHTMAYIPSRNIMFSLTVMGYMSFLASYMQEQRSIMNGLQSECESRFHIYYQFFNKKKDKIPSAAASVPVNNTNIEPDEDKDDNKSMSDGLRYRGPRAASD